MTRSPAAELAIDRLAELLNERIGLRPERTVRDRLWCCIRDEAARRGMDVDAYLDVVARADDALDSLLDRVTVQESSFFRHPEHFEILARDILPGLPQPVRIWSAACANGQEAYSLAMVLEEQGVDGSVIATDLAAAAVRRTAAGRYTGREVTGLSPERLRRHLTRTGTGWEVNPSILRRVTALRHNLLSPVPDWAGRCPVVFCRNVLIYLAPEPARTFLRRLADALPAGGVVFLSAAETIWQVTDRFVAVRVGESFVHRVRSAPAGTRAERPAPAAEPARPRTKAKPARPAAARKPPAAAPPVPEPVGAVPEAARAGQRASAAGDHRAAVVAYRRWTYLVPDDPMAHLHLGLALDALGDRGSARRAYDTAYRMLLDAADGAHLIDGYTPAELLRFVDAKRRVPAP